MLRLVVIVLLFLGGLATLLGQAKRVDYSKFQHRTHMGLVNKQELTCAYCHNRPSPEKPIVTGFPSTKPGNNIVHSACTDCHALQGREAIVRGEAPKMCLICHSSTQLSAMKNNIRQFPNLSRGIQSQFYDNFSHLEHSGYFELSSTMKARFKDKQKFKERDNFECAACHENPAPGITQSAPGHAQCFACHFNEKEVSVKRPTFATSCTGCHAANKSTKNVGSELAVLRFDRRIVQPQVKPFSHKTHEGAMGSNTKACMECHATAKKAEKLSDFYLPDRRTKVAQPRSEACVECHRKEMQTKISSAGNLTAAKCTYCHTMTMLEAALKKTAELPPPSHFYKKPTGTP